MKKNKFYQTYFLSSSSSSSLEQKLDKQQQTEQQAYSTNLRYLWIYRISQDIVYLRFVIVCCPSTGFCSHERLLKGL
jgi:hypothetical protein